MITLDVWINGENYRLPDAGHEKEIPILRLIQKGINHIFKPVIQTFPEHLIHVIWNEDQNELSYSCETLEKPKIAEVLKKHHGIDL